MIKNPRFLMRGDTSYLDSGLISIYVRILRNNLVPMVVICVSDHCMVVVAYVFRR